MTHSVPQTMAALVLTKPGSFEIQQVAVPVPGPYEVLCRVRAVAICGSDPRIVGGNWAGTWPPSYPFIPGHEWAGEIVAVGENASGFKIGDRVAGEAHCGCGHCSYCLQGLYNLCQNYGKSESGHRHYGFVSRGAYAQYGVFSIRSIRRMPPGVSFRESTMVDTAGVALHGIELTGVKTGGTSVVIGPGPIGLITMRLVRVLGGAKVIGIGTGSRLEAASKIADLVIDYKKDDPVKAVLTATNGVGVDEVFECSGAPETFAQSVRMVKKGGKVSLIGIPPDKVVTDLPFKEIVLNEISIFGSRANPNVSDKVLLLISSGQLVVKDLITHTFSLEEFGKGLDTFVNRREGAIKVVIEPNEPENPSARK
jgi:L-iditol 2-dehydrogenase